MISKKMIESLKGGSEIRKMFEEGGRLKAIYGADNVYDFSIGNPDLEPPKEVFDALKDLANTCQTRVILRQERSLQISAARKPESRSDLRQSA